MADGFITDDEIASTGAVMHDESSRLQRLVSDLLDLSRAGAGHLNEVLQMLEERYNLLELLAGALREDGVYLRIGHEMTQPMLQITPPRRS